MKTIIKYISVILIIALLVQTVSVSVLAAENTQITSEQVEALPSDPIESAEAGDSAPFIIEELEEERNANTKRFRMSDGTVTAAVYEEAVHYADGEEWKEINNSLALDNSDTAIGYANAENDFKVKLAENTGEPYLMKFEKNGLALTWQLADLQQDETAEEGFDFSAEEDSTVDFGETEDMTGALPEASEEIEAPDTSVTHLRIQKGAAALEEISEPVGENEISSFAATQSDAQLEGGEVPEGFGIEDKSVSAAIYEDILPGVDIQYVIEGDSVKKTSSSKKSWMITPSLSLSVQRVCD